MGPKRRGATRSPSRRRQPRASTPSPTSSPPFAPPSQPSPSLLSTPPPLSLPPLLSSVPSPTATPSQAPRDPSLPPSFYKIAHKLELTPPPPPSPVSPSKQKVSTFTKLSTSFQKAAGWLEPKDFTEVFQIRPLYQYGVDKLVHQMKSSGYHKGHPVYVNCVGDHIILFEGSFFLLSLSLSFIFFLPFTSL